jgi:secretion/DNA translocation related TadE-like protein
VIPRPAEERGSVTIVLVALLGMVMVIGMGLADVVAALGAAARAQDAADTAALAAAQEMAMPTGRSPADMAAEYAERNASSIISCDCDPTTFEAVVTVRVPVGGLLLFPDDRFVDASARAVVDLP